MSKMIIVKGCISCPFSCHTDDFDRYNGFKCTEIHSRTGWNEEEFVNMDDDFIDENCHLPNYKNGGKKMKINATKVYLILYNSHEFDDIDEGKDDIVFASLDEEKATEKFRQDIEKIKTNRPIFSFGDYEECEDNTKTNFQCYWGNRYYSLKLQAVELK